MKRTLSGIAAAALVLGTMAPAAFAATSSTMAYTDLGSYSWAASAINSLTLKGDIHGFADGQYRPASHVTRGQFLAYFMNTMKSVTGVTPGFDGTYYNDVKRGNWAYEYVGAAQKAGWIKPYWMDVRVGGNFNENYHASRGDAASLFVAAMENAGVISSTNGMTPLAYATSIGLFKGIPSGTNTVYLNRAAAAVVLKNMWTYVNGGTLTTQPVASSETLSLSTKTLVANGTSTDAVTAAVVDANGNPVSGVTVNFSSTDTSVATITSSAVTNSEGMATATITAGTTVGSTGIVASVSGVAPQVKLLTTTPANTAPMLSNLTVMGETVGAGTTTSPAAAIAGTAMSVNTTLTDAAGNPLSGVNLTYTISGSGVSAANFDALSAGSVLTGAFVTASDTTPASGTYTVTTNAEGQAPLSLNYIGSGTSSVSVSVSAPFTVSGSTLAPANSLNLTWGQPGDVVLSPAGSATAPMTEQYSTSNAATQGMVAYTATILPESGQSVSDLPVQFTLTSVNQSNATAAYFTNAQGQEELGSTNFTAYTNNEGQATVYVNSMAPQANGVVNLSAGATTYSLTAEQVVSNVVDTATGSTQYVEWDFGGQPASIANLTAATATPTAGTNDTITGTLEDVNGNPVSNAQLLVTGTLDTSSGTVTDSYVASNGTVTPFTSSGFNVTTNTQGDFSFTVTDSQTNSDTYNVEYYGLNGQVVTGSNTTTVTWAASTNPSTLSVATQSSMLSATNNTVSIQTVNSSPATLYTDAYTAQGTALALSVGGLQSVTYTVTAPNHALVTSVNNQWPASLPSSGVQSAQITINYLGDVTVNGVSAGNVTAGSAVVPFQVSDTYAENDAVTVTSGSMKATANVNFTTGSVYAVNLSSQSVVANYGQAFNETFTAEDQNGNPIPDSTVYLFTNTNGSLNLPNAFITAVNGQTLTENFNGTNEPTPVPLFTASGLGYTAVYANGISAYDLGSSPMVSLMTGSNGQVTVTMQNGNVPYWNATSGVYSVQPYVYGTPTTSTVYVYGSSTTTGNTSVGSGTFQW